MEIYTVRSRICLHPAGLKVLSSRAMETCLGDRSLQYSWPGHSIVWLIWKLRCFGDKGDVEDITEGKPKLWFTGITYTSAESALLAALCSLPYRPAR